MKLRHSAALAAYVVLSLPTSMIRADVPPARCGFDAAPREAETARAGVPLLLRAGTLHESAHARIAARRDQLLSDDRVCSARHPQTARYLRSILQRLVERSGLQQFAASTPGLTLAMTCSSAVPLPVARASAGNIVLVPRALPALARSEDAIAAVLAHELAHLTLRHHEQLIGATVGTQALAYEETRALKSEHERQADIAGLKLLVDAGYDPRAAIEHMQSVEALAAQLKRAGRRPRRSGAPTHDGIALRMRLLQTQIAACAYDVEHTRTPVPSSVQLELSEPAASAPSSPEEARPAPLGHL